MHFNRKTIILASCLLILILIILRVIGTIQSRNYEQVLKQGVIKITPYWSENKVIIDEVVIYVESADTSEKKSKGLGGKTHLSDNYGMLFPFKNQPYPPVFWMKGMEIPIDIIWIKDNTIIDIDKSAQPESGISDAQLKRYSPDKPVDYVLEVKGGLSDEKGFEVGDSVIL